MKEAQPTRAHAHMCRDGHEEIGHNDSRHEMCPLCQAESKAERLREAAEKVLADHDERMRIYPREEGQPNRLVVFADLRKALAGE